ncbi:MAG TPA: dihydroorotate dehydrogenase electron transfer subunit [Thermoplasmata archaeon]|nr:dihydroorotate dehydrogenase electron transfer subunit [Thermoplasmata archaeon]
MRRIVRVTERVVETPSTVTLRFPADAPAGPGQFVMLWVPGDDEVPMSLSYTGADQGVTVKVMGATSRAIQGIAPGTPVGIRGPYGNRFDLTPARILIVAGGSGAAVLAPAAEAAKARGARIAVALGATTASELLFLERFRRMGASVRVSTDDGSQGAKGFVTPVAEAWLGEERFDALWTCGPEVMMRKAIDAARAAGVPSFGSVERIMKCSLGICDACAFGPFHVCVDGPVFSGATLATVPDFGAFQRDAAGRRARR